MTPLSTRSGARRGATRMTDAGRRPFERTWLGRAIRHRAFPLCAGLVTGLYLTWIWGGLTQPPVIHDEIASRLQADLFASGRWTAPARPDPTAFAAFHIQVAPTTAAKYFPGHALWLAPFAAAGVPGLGPVLAASLAAALLLALGRVVVGAGVSAIAWVLWLTSPGVMLWGPSYFSESTTLLCWAAALTACWRWARGPARDPAARRRTPGLVLIALFLAVGAITRPLTMAALALPILGVVFVRLWVQRGTPARPLRASVVALAVGLAVLGVVPLWSARTTGTWRDTPITRYTHEYLPFDRLGFGLDTTKPARELPPVMQAFSADFAAVHARHTVAALPATLGQRAKAVLDGATILGGPATLLLALVGLFMLPVATWVALAGVVGLFAAYLLYAHPVGWTVYYHETGPILALATAAGLVATARLLAALEAPLAPRLWRGGSVLAAIVLALWTGNQIATTATSLAARHRRATDGLLARQAFITSVPTRPAIVFIRHEPQIPPDLVDALPSIDLAGSPVWVVWDLGPARNAALLARFPERAGYRVTRATGAWEPLGTAAQPANTGTRSDSTPATGNAPQGSSAGPASGADSARAHRSRRLRRLRLPPPAFEVPEIDVPDVIPTPVLPLTPTPQMP